MSDRGWRNRRSRWKERDLANAGHQCGMKRSYPDETAAQGAIDSLRQAGKAGESSLWLLHAYVCRCGSWHIGHYMPRSS